MHTTLLTTLKTKNWIGKHLDEKKQYEEIRETCISTGGNLLLSDIKAHKEASDTIKIFPLQDQKTGAILVTQTEQMLKQQGYVAALEWIIGIVEHYQNNEYQGDN